MNESMSAGWRGGAAALGLRGQWPAVLFETGRKASQQWLLVVAIVIVQAGDPCSLHISL